MAGQVHGIVENPDDLDRMFAARAIHDEMPPASASAGQVKSSEAPEDFATIGASGHIRTTLERFELRSFLDLTIFHEAQSFPHHFAGILVTPASHKTIDKGRLSFSQHNITSGRRSTSEISFVQHGR